MMIAETERLRVRYLRDDDFQEMHALCSDPLAMRFMGDGSTLTAEQVTTWIEKSQWNYQDHRFGCFAVETRAERQFVGFCGLVYPHEHQNHVEIIYAFSQPHWGKGYATEAARAVLDYGFTRCNLPRIVATIVPANTASRRIAEKLGMRFVGIVQDAGEDVAFYELLNPQQH
ncbi:ribosomal-protein-alanine N-acetyltransferase [Thermosporothrix hazakensis]|jgi:RimJ/RimL family protein N-acetyltransferase|uniref:Ribosomal-protein-alanine N-acetyltransferase n=1 Tax=Thermosporothrix hazakensis TaxID=644383 RepID=A0A326UBM8_THEHA|nr:GNAT family N-acetyltransferase [Thermosporothrix hazakensis]PZW34500.1 ribosomal-protein-alanine N-acetyltransferase [Thermosporothrix hazakensis]GCE45951.1 N-acetyltransferase [Thermosporothrix hazakensis]